MTTKTPEEKDWYNPTPLAPELYRDGYCIDHGDCAAIYREVAWRCVICGATVETEEDAAQEAAAIEWLNQELSNEVFTTEAE